VSLVVLCLAAFTMVALVVSVLVGATLSWLDRIAAKLSPRHRVRWWLVLAALPWIVAVLAVGASFFPAIGVGHDHCLAHGSHHPHLCPHHRGEAPGIVLVVIALLLCTRTAQLLVALGRGIRRSRDTLGSLAQACEERACVRVFPSDDPQAFVLGTLRPMVHVSSGLLALGPHIVEPVLAHERVHARRRDLLWRALCPVMAVGHWPMIANAVRMRVMAAQEMAADAEAAETLSDGRFKIAEALVLVARMSRMPSIGMSFTQGDLKTRVQALLEGHRKFSNASTRALLLCALRLPVALGASHDLIHHGLETLLGVLSPLK